MIKVAKKEKINYLKPSSKTSINTINNNINNINNIEDIQYSNEYQNLNTNNSNDINTTLSNISNQLKNIAIIDKSKEQKLLNSSFRVTNRNKNLNSFFDTTNIESNQKFHNLQRKKVFNIFFPKSLKYENINIDETQKENLELKENVKFLLKQIKRYQKSGLTIEDMNINREQKIQQLEQEILELKNELNSYKEQLLISHENNESLKKENQQLKEYINIYDNINIKESNERKNKFDEIEKDNINNNNKYIYKNNRKTNIDKNEEEENEINSNSKLSDELLYEINKELLQSKNNDNKYKNKSYLSEGKLYTRKNIGKNLSFNYEPKKINIFNKYKTNRKFNYSNNLVKNK